jgi:transcription elongation GreA/GreB family factor
MSAPYRQPLRQKDDRTAESAYADAADTIAALRARIRELEAELEELKGANNEN